MPVIASHALILVIGLAVSLAVWLLSPACPPEVEE